MIEFSYDIEKKQDVEILLILRNNDILVTPYSVKKDRLLYHKTYWTKTDKIKRNNMSNQSTKQIVQEVATQLLKSNNTVTTLEIKTQLRKTHGKQAWYQSLISSIMDELYYDGVFDYTDNGTFRVYSLPASASKASVSNSVAFVKVAKATPKTKTTQKVSKTKALDLLQNTGGRYFGVTFTKKDGSVRNMKCKVLDNTNPDSLGYLTVFDATEKTNKKVNMQTLSEIRMNKTVYKIA